MKEASWDDCLYTHTSIKVTPDREKVKSLIEIAKERVVFVSGKSNEKMINYIFEGYYSSIAELIHAMVLLDGYKVNNHVCLGHYLRDILKREDLFRVFDDCRFKRNSLVYYGKRMEVETGKEAIMNAKQLFDSVYTVLLGKLK